MNQRLKEIPIFFAVDDAYIPFLAVALHSLIENSSKNYQYSIKILHTSISDENKRKIDAYQKENVTIEFVELKDSIEKIKDRLYTRDYFTKATYFRLFISDLYPEYDKVLYLDSDIVILSDVAELYNIDIGDNLIAATSDGAVQSIEVFQEYVEKVVGVAEYGNYFNAGVLLMNLKALREFKFQEKFLYLLETVKYSVAQDQDYLNRLCKGRVKILDSAWDIMPVEGERRKREEIHLIHYNLVSKPWHFEDVAYQEYFWEYAKKTEFFDKIQEIKKAYTDEERAIDLKTGEKLIELAQKESNCVGDDRRYRR
ncbi:MAG: glycosyltransferase family 8 protein [Clostridia bacterium]|nr:glycosyltransferase family 8 protein [Clostridia bacterium]